MKQLNKAISFKHIISSSIFLMLLLSGCERDDELVYPIKGDWYLTQSLDAHIGIITQIAKGEIVWSFQKKNKLTISNSKDGTVQEYGYEIKTFEGKTFLKIDYGIWSQSPQIDIENKKLNINYSNLLMRDDYRYFEKSEIGGLNVLEK